MITALHGAEGETIAVGSVLVEIDTSAAKPAGDAAPAPAAKAASEAAVVPAPEKPAAANGSLAKTVSHHARRLAPRKRR